MDPDNDVCLCFHVPLRKIRTYLAREDPPVASLISECLGAGTGCQWCVPFLKALHAQHRRGEVPDLKVSPEQYTKARLGFHKSGKRDEGVLRQAGAEEAGGMGGASGAGGSEGPPAPPTGPAAP